MVIVMSSGNFTDVALTDRRTVYLMGAVQNYTGLNLCQNQPEVGHEYTGIFPNYLRSLFGKFQWYKSESGLTLKSTKIIKIIEAVCIN
jgi:hypothetical protein